MVNWVEKSGLAARLDAKDARLLDGVAESRLQRGTVLFRPGDAVKGFAVLTEGRIGVYLSGPNGRDILLYDITPGQTCVQSTLGILGGEDYSGEAICETDCSLALIPRGLFETLLARSTPFRGFVFNAFATRMQAMMHLLEKVAFVRIETRLAAALLARLSDDGAFHGTHAELARAIGSAREVVSRRLLALAGRGLLRLERGRVAVIDRDGLEKLSEIS